MPGATTNAPEPQAVIAAVRDMIRSAQSAPPLRTGDLTLIPLLPAPEYDKDTMGYLPLEEALQRNLVAITEQPQAQVPGLLAVSVADEPVVLVNGEQVIGGLQNRVLNTTILLAPHAELTIPVTCVESGRWHGADYRATQAVADEGDGAPQDGETRLRRQSAFTSGDAAYASLRKMHTKAVSSSLTSGAGHRSDQAAVWGSVAARLQDTETEAFSPSSAMEALYRAPERASALRESLEALKRPEGAIGFVAILHGTPLGAELFADEALAAAYWEKLARSYVIEALDAGAAETADAANPATEAGEMGLLADALAADVQVHPSPGLGADARIAGQRVSGAGLVYEGRAIHLSLFHEEADATTESSHSSVARHPRRRTTAQ
jgi:hypothetical protein